MKKITTFLLSLACFMSLVAWADEPTYVAQIGTDGRKYETLQAALKATNDGDTVYLIADTTETVSTQFAAEGITLHINEGVTLTGKEWYTIFNYQNTLTIEGEGAIVNTINPSYSTAFYNQEGTLYVRGGTIEAKQYIFQESSSVKTEVTGGKFNLNPRPWLANKYTTTKSSDGKYFVVEALTYVAKIGKIEYETLQAAMDAVEEGQMIELACSTTEEITFDKNFIVAIKSDGYNYGTISGAMGLWERWDGQYSNVAKYVVISKSMEELVEHVTDNIAKYPGTHGRFYIYDDWTLAKSVTIPTVNDLSQSIFTVKDTFVLDLNGFTLDQAPVERSHGGYPTIVASHGKKVTIKDSSEEQTGVLCGVGWAVDIYDNPGTCVTLESGTITTHGAVNKGASDMRGRVIRIMGGKFIMNGGRITLEHLIPGNQIFGVITASTAVASTPHIEINGGYVECATEEQLWNEDGSNPNCLIGGSKGKDSEVSITNGSFTANPPIEYFAESSRPVLDEETGLYTVVEVAAKVVSEGDADVFFTSLKEAFAAANGKTIRLLKNQSLDVTKTDDSLKVPKGVTMTLDLNGYTLASVATAATSSQLILNEGTLTIMDSSDANKDGSGSGRIVVNAKPAWQYDGDPRHTGSYASNGILNKGTLTIESGYLTNATSGSAAYVVDNNSSGSTANLTINGGWLYQWFVAAVRQFANSTTYENNVTINGGIVEGYRFEWIQLPGSTLSVAPKATLTVTGGELKSTQASGTQKVFYTYSYGNSRENSYITIEGGIWRGVLSFTEGVDTNNNAIKSTENIEITGGYFTEDIYTFAWWYGDDEAQAKKFIKGGCFAKHPNSSYYRFGVCPGYGVYYNEDPETMVEFPYEVREIPVVELTVTENDVPIKVQEETLYAMVGEEVYEGLNSEDQATREAAEQAVSEKLHEKETNGLEVWQNYVLGLDGATEDLGVTTEDTSASKIEIVPVTDPAPNSGFTVSYKMDYTDAEETTTTLDTLDIELEGEKDPTGVYQVKALLTPENGGDPIVVETKNKVGVVKAIQPMELAIVSVPWKKLSLAAHSEDIPVADLVKTTTLDQGDMLLDYNGENYDAWALTAEKTWKSVGKVIKTENGMELVESPDPTKTTVKRGSGVFLKRKDHKKPYYLYGQVDDSEVVETLPDKVNLVANPNVTDFDLNAEGAVSAAEGDIIIVPTVAAPKKCTKEEGKWGYQEDYIDNRGIVRQRRVSDVKIPAGTGFWYEKGAKSNSSKINWSK